MSARAAKAAQPAEPFVIVAQGDGFMAENLPNLYAWLLSDAIRDQHIDQVEVGADLYDALGGKPVLRVDADAANNDLYETSERTSPKDDLTLPIRKATDGLGPQMIRLLRQTPPGQQP